MNTYLSIITPTLNCASTIRGTIASIQPLIDRGAEYLVVDSGSTDGTVEMAESAGATVFTYPKGNMYAAINHGMRHAKGEWLTYINGDDVLYADAIQEMLERVDQEVSVQYGNIDYMDESGRFLFSWRSPSEMWLRLFITAYSPVPQQGTVFRKQVFQELNGFNTNFRYSADYEFWVRALKKGFVFQKYTARSVAGFRLLATQLSQANKREMAPEGISIRRELGQEYSAASRFLIKAWATVYRNFSNIDSHYLRAKRGRGLDKR